MSLDGQHAWSMPRGRRISPVSPCALLLLAATLASTAPWAQGNQFGGQDRADAAQNMIVLSVQQAISALPPASGQAFTYEFDPEKDTFVRSAILGPTVLRSPRPVGKGKLSLRFSASYFSLSQQFAPITYAVDVAEPGIEAPTVYGKLGLDVGAKVGLFTLAATYGLADRIDVTLVVPVTVVHASAAQSFTTRADSVHLPPTEAVLSGARSPEALDALVQEGLLAVRRDSFQSLGFDFNGGTPAGVGRISAGARGVVYADPRWRLAIAPELYFPSPNEAQFAGPDSFALLGRAIGEVAVTGPLRVFMDAGYDYDFDQAELRRFVGSFGAQLAFDRFEIDSGIAASVFDRPIRWTPSVARGDGSEEFLPTILTAQQDNTLGDDFVDFVLGGKVKLSQRVVLAGAATVPINDQGFRPSVLGTIALEVSY